MRGPITKKLIQVNYRGCGHWQCVAGRETEWAHEGGEFALISPSFALSLYTASSFRAVAKQKSPRSSLPFRFSQLLDSLVILMARQGANAAKRSALALQDITSATFECRSMRVVRCASHSSSTLSRFKTLRHQSHTPAVLSMKRPIPNRAIT